MTNKVIRQASKCVNCVVKKSRFSKRKTDKKFDWDNINLKYFIYQIQAIIKHVTTLLEAQKTEKQKSKRKEQQQQQLQKNRKCRSKTIFKKMVE